ncbi:MAG: hypothetical protein J6I46_09395 [Ruminococcus sp.]|nr:hypothetical protein [Ruminococcus sp.]
MTNDEKISLLIRIVLFVAASFLYLNFTMVKEFASVQIYVLDLIVSTVSGGVTL